MSSNSKLCCSSEYDHFINCLTLDQPDKLFKKEHCANWMEPKKRAHMHDFKQIDLYSSKLHRSMEHHKAGYKANFNSTVEKLLKA